MEFPDKARLGAACLMASLAIGLGIFTACSTSRTVTAPPEIEGAHFVGNQACNDCHTNYARVFAFSAHGKFHSDDLKMAGQSGCESCHGPGSKHIQAGGAKQFIFNPGKDATSCFNCHLDVHAEFKLPHHHPVIENRLNCIQCHDPHGQDIRKPKGGLAMARLNETCAGCHRDQTRRFVFEHEAMREGCTVCHNPHGSVNDKMLTQRDANLCLRCHAQAPGPLATPGTVYIGAVDHTSFIRRATCWSAGCHPALHGSNVDVKLRY